MRYLLGGIILATGLTACQAKYETTPTDDFFVNLGMLCDRSLTGTVVSDDPRDADWQNKVLTVGPIDCSDSSMIKLPLAVGGDTSRIWSLAINDETVALAHAHTLKDGSPDPVTGYGGTSNGIVTNHRLNFPVDQFSKDLFSANGLEASVTNVWTLEIRPDEVFAYELNREGRHFRAEFPLNKAE